MREGVLPFRERGFGPAAVDHFLGRHRPTWLLAAGAAILFAGVGAFETGEAPPLTRYIYWLPLTFACGALGAWTLDRFGSLASFRDLRQPRFILSLLVMTGVMTLLVFVASGLALQGEWTVKRLPHLWLQVLLVGGFFFALQLTLEGRREEETAADPPAVPLSLEARLPAGLREAEIQAVQAEDHYLRVHTDAGSALILMRLSDAIAELGQLEGAQTHRSWWVARAAIAEARPSRGRARLILKNGVEAPVSRTYARDLRRDGWY